MRRISTSPRLDLKQNPLYEDTDLALLKTHYYGGIKKYQWTALPLAIYGVVVHADGTRTEIAYGDGEDDPVFCVTDLLPHLARKQMAQKLSEAITGESLNVLVGSMPADTDKEKVKEAVLLLLNEKYGMTEEDFLSAEIEVVPSGRARDVGFDRSMVGSYGQDDRVCAYSALRGILELDAPEKTAVCLLADKEEIGKHGQHRYAVRLFCGHHCGAACKDGRLLQRFAGAGPSQIPQCLSADVGAGDGPLL